VGDNQEVFENAGMQKHKKPITPESDPIHTIAYLFESAVKYSLQEPRGRRQSGGATTQASRLRDPFTPFPVLRPILHISAFQLLSYSVSL